MSDATASGGPAPSAARSLLDPQVQTCPFPYYEQVQAESPVLLMPETGYYLVTRYEDLAAVLSDPQTYSNDIRLSDRGNDESTHLARVFEQRLDERGWAHVQTLQRTDPPEHQRYRRLINEIFTPTRVKAMVPGIESICDRLLDAVVPTGRCDVVADYAFKVPGTVISEQLGLPADQIDRFRLWSEAMLAPAQGLVTDEAAALRFADLEVEAQHYFAELFEVRRRAPTDDLVSALVVAAQDEADPLSMAEFQSLMNQLVTGGYLTTADAITSGLWLLLKHPDQLRALRADRGLLRNFTEEVLRFLSPVQGLFRKTTREVGLGGVSIPAGAVLHVRYGAANRDGRFFERPDAFDLTRKGANRHLAFGRGPHVCPGAPLARQEIMIAIDRLLDRMDDIELVSDAEPVHNLGLLFYSLKELPIRFTAR